MSESCNRPVELTSPPSPPRRYSRWPLPAYRHVPGLTPHPVKHPDGHAFDVDAGAPAEACRDLPEHWRRCTHYLYGVDLFNRAFLWEAHEAWEMVWIAVARSSEPGQFVQGLIQVAAGLLRRHLGTERGARRLIHRAGHRFDFVQSGLVGGPRARYMGVELPVWRRQVQAYLVGSDDRYPFLRLEP